MGVVSFKRFKGLKISDFQRISMKLRNTLFKSRKSTVFVLELSRILKDFKKIPDLSSCVKIVQAFVEYKKRVQFFLSN